MEITFVPQIEGSEFKITLLIDNKPLKVEDSDFRSDFPENAYDLSNSEDMSALSSNSELMPRLMEILQSLGLDTLMDAGSDMDDMDEMYDDMYDMDDMDEESESDALLPTEMESEEAEIPAETTVVAP